MAADDVTRSFIATFLLALYLPVPFYLLWVHSLQTLWRKMGVYSYVIHTPLYLFTVYEIVAHHSVWVWKAGPWPAAFSYAGIFPLGLAAFLATRTYRSIDFRTLHLVSQIDPSRGRRLITDGILGRIRHPRYTMFMLIALGNVLVTGYPLVLASLALCTALYVLVIRLEERELVRYFGEEYLAYRRNVPAFIPRFTSGRRGGA